MNRRRFLVQSAALPLLPTIEALVPRSIVALGGSVAQRKSRVRPTDLAWPSPADWDRLKNQLAGELIRVVSPLRACAAGTSAADCDRVFQDIRNPYYVGDDPGLTQTSGWLGAWASRPSVFALAARSANDVAAGVRFARDHNLRLVIRGGGHSYQGTSDSADSLMIWTRHMNDVALHDAFVPDGCEGIVPPRSAVTLGAGAMWIDAYDAVTTKARRYVQGGGCTTVGVAGLVQSGGFGSYSKGFGTAAAGLLQAEVVTADGAVRIANARRNPDLFWALKGGGGGTFGVVTRITLRTHALPDLFGNASAAIHATSPAAYRALLARFMDFYFENLLNPHWGEQFKVGPTNDLEISMNCQGLTTDGIRVIWQPFFDWVAARPADFRISDGPDFSAGAAQRWWDAAYRAARGSTSMVRDPRPGSPPSHAWWRGDGEQVGVFLHAYESTWLPRSLLEPGRREEFIDALFAASREWEVQLHCNKGLAGAPRDVIEAARDTATNPAVLDAFALAISAAGEAPAFRGMPGHEPHVEAGRANAQKVRAATGLLRRLVPNVGSYVSESNFFENDWQHAFWGTNYDRLLAIKRKYDPEELFFVRHGVGTEAWSDDGFTRLK